MWLKRILLFCLVNLGFIIMITTVSHLLGIDQIYTSQAGAFGLHLDLTNLALYSMLIGFSGAFLSLAISRWMVKRIYRIKLIDETTSEPHYQRVLQQVQAYAALAQLPNTPEVGVYDSAEPNAFATGPSKRRSIVAVSTGLLNSLSEDEVDGVLAHEVAHIANGDMVTMTLLQGVVNTFVVFLAKILAHVITARNGRNSSGAVSSFWLEILFQVILGIIGSMIVMKFSRYREFRADYGGATLCGVGKMTAALKKLQLIQNQMALLTTRRSSGLSSALQSESERTVACMKISRMKSKSTFGQLFSSHPPLQARIQRLESNPHLV